MKKSIITLILLSFYTLSMLGQEKIIYNPHHNTFDGPSSVKKGEKISVYIKNFNPFIFSYDVKITTKDNTKKLFDFFSGILSQKYEIKSLTNFGLTGTSTLVAFNTLLNKYIVLQNELKNPYFDCIEINKTLAKISGTDIYLEYLNLKKADRDNVVLIENKIIELSELRVSLIYYLNHNINDITESTLKVGEYIATGSSNTIKIKLSSNDGNTTFKIADSIIGMKKILIKNALKVDFSTGLFFTQNNEPQYFKINDNNNYVIGEEVLNKYQIGLNALAHIYLNKDNNLNLTLGSGVTIDKAIHLLTGISYKLSESNIILNFGADFSNYNELSDAFELGKEYATDIEIKTKKRWNNALWFGISYKL